MTPHAGGAEWGSGDVLLTDVVAVVCTTNRTHTGCAGEGGNPMVSKIVSVVADELFGEYFWATVPVVAIILGAIAFVAIGLLRGG